LVAFADTGKRMSCNGTDVRCAQPPYQGRIVTQSKTQSREMFAMEQMFGHDLVPEPAVTIFVQ
jgi:hypothetical protein